MRIRNANKFGLRALAMLVLAGCGTALDARADAYPSVNADLWCYHHDDSTGNYVSDYYGEIITNATYSGAASFHWEVYFNDAADGAYSYYDLERNYDGANMSYVMRIADAHIDAPYVGNFNAQSGGGTQLQILEDMMVVYFPSSATDKPPTQISFQISYSVLGQAFNQLHLTPPRVYWFGGAQASIGGGSGGSTNLYANYGVGTGVLTPVSVQVLSQAYTVFPNSQFQLNLYLAGQDSGWYSDENYTDPNQPATLDLRLALNGFVNFVDQNNQPIAPGNLLFYFFNAGQPILFPYIKNLAGPQTIALAAIPGTNGLLIQWPSYATNYQLEMATSLDNGSWTTNSLPPPVESGPFLQVTVPTKNAAAFFRLLQTN